MEILVALSIMAILFVPMMQLFSQALEGTNTSRDLITAVSLASWEMERTNNLGTRTERLKRLGNTAWPPEGEPAFELNGRAWWVYRILDPDSDPLRVTIEVRREGETRVLAQLVTLFSDTVWERQVQAGP